MLELAVLGLLAEQPMHGYELKKRLSETLGPLWGISFGSLYPALRRLEKSGAIVETVAEPDSGSDATPFVPTGSLSGDIASARLRRRPRATSRKRKAYQLTDRGRELFFEELNAPDADDERSFALRLSFCRFLSAPERLTFLERRRAQLAQRLAPTRRPATARTIDRYTRALLEHRARTTQHDLEWLDELIAQERENLERPDPDLREQGASA